MSSDSDRKLFLGEASGRQMLSEGHDSALAPSAKYNQALFANVDLRTTPAVGDYGLMSKRRRAQAPRMQHLRAWRESLGLSRQEVANRIGTLVPTEVPLDQGAIAKWESGETAVRVEDIALLAQVYGVTPDRLFFTPGDERTPRLLEQAHAIITQADPEAVARWLSMGQILVPRTPPNENAS